MGCSASKKFQDKIKEQANKIDELITINENLQKNLLEMQQNVLTNLVKYNTDTTSDLTNLRVNLDQRFNKLEKTIEKINSLTMKESEKPGLISFSKNKIKNNMGDIIDHEENNFTLSLNFDKDQVKNNNNNVQNDVSQWNKLLNDENIDISNHCNKLKN